MARNRFDVIIVNWNSGPQLKYCVESLAGSIAQQTIVVDNASSDGSEQAVAELPCVTLIRSTENLGFGKACNLGAQASTAEYLLFFNPDAAVLPSTLEATQSFMQDTANKLVGICGVQLVDESGHVARSCARFPSAGGFVAHAFGLDRVFPHLGHAMVEWPHDSTREVDHVIGAFFLVRRSVFEALDGFDERFFVYLEDLDFSYRARQAGWRSAYLADVQAFHAGGGTSKQVKAKRLFYSLRSRLLYSAKHFPWWQAWVVIAATGFVEPVTRIAYCLLRRDWAGARNTLSAYRMLWRNMRLILRGEGRVNP